MNDLFEAGKLEEAEIVLDSIILPEFPFEVSLAALVTMHWVRGKFPELRQKIIEDIRSKMKAEGRESEIDEMLHGLI